MTREKRGFLSSAYLIHSQIESNVSGTTISRGGNLIHFSNKLGNTEPKTSSEARASPRVDIHDYTQHSPFNFINGYQSDPHDAISTRISLLEGMKDPSTHKIPPKIIENCGVFLRRTGEAKSVEHILEHCMEQNWTESFRLLADFLITHESYRLVLCAFFIAAQTEREWYYDYLLSSFIESDLSPPPLFTQMSQTSYSTISHDLDTDITRQYDDVENILPYSSLCKWISAGGSVLDVNWRHVRGRMPVKVSFQVRAFLVVREDLTQSIRKSLPDFEKRIHDCLCDFLFWPLDYAESSEPQIIVPSITSFASTVLQTSQFNDRSIFPNNYAYWAERLVYDGLLFDRLSKAEVIEWLRDCVKFRLWNVVNGVVPHICSKFCNDDIMSDMFWFRQGDRKLHLLHIAAKYGRIDTISILRDFGVDINLFDGRGDYTCLVYSAMEERTECLDYLIQKCEANMFARGKTHLNNLMKVSCSSEFDDSQSYFICWQLVRALEQHILADDEKQSEEEMDIFVDSRMPRREYEAMVETALGLLKVKTALFLSSYKEVFTKGLDDADVDEHYFDCPCQLE